MTDVPRGTSVTCARPHSNLHDNDSTTIIDKKTLFGVHAQVSYTIIEAHKQYSLLDTIFNHIFYLGPPGKYL